MALQAFAGTTHPPNILQTTKSHNPPLGARRDGAFLWRCCCCGSRLASTALALGTERKRLSIWSQLPISRSWSLKLARSTRKHVSASQYLIRRGVADELSMIARKSTSGAERIVQDFQDVVSWTFGELDDDDDANARW